MSEIPHESLISPELTALEGALRELPPRTSTLDRDVLLFRAGQASTGSSKRAWAWQCATAISTAVALILGSVLAFRQAQGGRERTVYINLPSPSAVNASTTPRQEDDVDGSSIPEVQPPVYQSAWWRLPEHLIRWEFDDQEASRSDSDVKSIRKAESCPTWPGASLSSPFPFLGE